MDNRHPDKVKKVRHWWIILTAQTLLVIVELGTGVFQEKWPPVSTKTLQGVKIFNVLNIHDAYSMLALALPKPD
jgi:hypothetical protein